MPLLEGYDGCQSSLWLNRSEVTADPHRKTRWSIVEFRISLESPAVEFRIRISTKVDPKSEKRPFGLSERVGGSQPQRGKPAGTSQLFPPTESLNFLERFPWKSA